MNSRSPSPPISRDAPAVRDRQQDRASSEARPDAVGLSDQFVADPRKVAQWAAFTKRESLLHDVGGLDMVVGSVRDFVMPPLIAAATSRYFTRRWKPGGPWKVQRKRARP